MALKMWGGNPPSQYQSADGSWFIGFNIPGSAQFRVFREYPDGRTEPVNLGVQSDGQGMLCLQPDGTLWASFGETTGNAVVKRVQIASWQAHKPVQEATTPAQPVMTEAMSALWRGRDYVGTDFDTVEEIALRVDKQRKALLDVIEACFKR